MNRLESNKASIIQLAVGRTFTGQVRSWKRGLISHYDEAIPAIIIIGNVEWTSAAPRNEDEAEHINSQLDLLK